MGYDDAWAALHMEMPPRVPRTEYSADTYHWPLMRAVTGLDADADSPPAERLRVANAFRAAWDYGFIWNVLLNGGEFGPWRTDMGHAAYAEGGTDQTASASVSGDGPFRTPEDVLAFDALAALGRPDAGMMRRRFEEHYRQSQADTPGVLNMTGIYITCVSGVIDLFGWDLLLTAAGEDPDGFGATVNRYAAWNQHNFEALAAADVPVVMVHDDLVWTSGAFIRPDWYRRYVFPNLKRMIEPLRDSGKKVLFTSDGDFTEFIDDIAACGVHGFVLEPCTDMKRIVDRYGQTHAIVGNADTRVLLSGSRDDIRAEVERCMALGKQCPGYFLAVGNHIPANTPIDSARYYNECYMRMRDR